ncbi:MAG: PAS domain S-box protein [Chthoniobacteraceae bacterium]|jgi:PAS domain S-box-containing protein
MEVPPPAGGDHPNPVEMALHDSEARLRAILQTAVEGIITIDERGVIESVNPAARQLFGYAQEEMVGRNVTMLMPEPYSSEHDDYLANYMRTGKGKIIGVGREVMGRRKDGSVFSMDLSVGEVRLGGERFFTGIVRDITERKRLEREVLEISDREQRRLGQDLHDDLCQHLAGIGLMSEVLEQKLAGTPEQPEAARIAARVWSAIEQTRKLARGLSPLEIGSGDVMAALAQLASNTTEIFHVQCRFQEGNPVRIENAAVSTHLYRIAQEAISNAVRHGGADEIEVSLEAENGEAALSIADNGSGFSEPKPNSHGMGLSIMKYRAGMIGGVLEARPAEGGGVVVTCRFRPALTSIL